ncbi:MAG: hypothetical protein QXI84_11425, partial [Thermofilaceae archaeon]
IWDLATAPLVVLLSYLLPRWYGVAGMVMAFAVSTVITLAFRLLLLGRISLVLIANLYVPAVLSLFMIDHIPVYLLPYGKDNIVVVIITYIPNIVILGTIALFLLYILSRPFREILDILISRLLKR